MTAPTELMAQLQAAWGAIKARPPNVPHALIVPQEQTIDSEPTVRPFRVLPMARYEPKSPPRCRSHLDPTLWESRPIDDGTNRVLTTCSLCGTFIGFGPSDRQRKKLTA